MLWAGSNQKTREHGKYHMCLFCSQFFSMSVCLPLQVKKKYEAIYILGLYQHNCFYDEIFKFQWHKMEAKLPLHLLYWSEVVWCNIFTLILTSHCSRQPDHFCWQNVWRVNNLLLYFYPLAIELHFAAIIVVKFCYITALTLKDIVYRVVREGERPPLLPTECHSQEWP